MLKCICQVPTFCITSSLDSQLVFIQWPIQMSGFRQPRLRLHPFSSSKILTFNRLVLEESRFDFCAPFPQAVLYHMWLSRFYTAHSQTPAFLSHDLVSLLLPSYLQLLLRLFDLLINSRQPLLIDLTNILHILLPNPFLH